MNRNRNYKRILSFLKHFSVFAIVFFWIYSGGPQDFEFQVGEHKIEFSLGIKEAQAAWTLVGTTTQRIENGNTENITLPGSIVENDIVLVILTADYNTGNAVLNTSGYTTIFDTGNAVPVGLIKYKIMGETPDTVVQVTKTDSGGSNPRDMGAIVEVWRGVDTATPIDTSPATNTQNSSGDPNSPSYTTTTDGALVFSVGQLDDDIATVTGIPSGFTNLTYYSGDPDANASDTGMISSMEKASAGAINPSAYVTSGDDEWEATTFALRPAADGPPTVTTQAASSVATTTATLNGNITDTGGTDATVRGFAWGTNSALSGGDTATTTDTAGQPFGTGAFTGAISSLTCNTTYYARAYATNVNGDGLGTIVSFTTSACAPTVTTQDATDLAVNSATLNGNITVTGGTNSTVRGFAYGTDSTLATVVATTTEAGDFGTGAFTKAVSSLTCNTTYYARAYSTNTAGDGLGSIQSFTTSACAPTVTTQSASSVTQTTATLNGNITATGGDDATVRGFAYGTDSVLETVIATTTDTAGQPFGTGAFTGAISSLTCNTTYYARAYATNTSGDGLGTIISFTTSGCPSPRYMRLLSGFTIKIISGTIILHQE